MFVFIEGFNENVDFKILHVTDVLLFEDTIYRILLVENTHMGAFKSMLAVAISLVTCIYMATSLVGIIPDVNEDDVIRWFQA